MRKRITIINPTSNKQIKKLTKKPINSRSGEMAVRKRKRAAVKRTSNPVVYANRRRRTHRRRNPSTVGAFSMEGVTDTLMQGLIAGAGAAGVSFAVNKFFKFDNVWMKYLALAGIGLGGGYIVGTFNKNLGKQVSIGTIAMVIATIVNDQFLKGPALMGDYDDEFYGEINSDAALANLTLGEMANINQLSQNNLLGAAAQGSGSKGGIVSNQFAYSDRSDSNPYAAY